MNIMTIIDEVKTAAIESACASTAELSFSEKTLIGIVLRASKPIIGKFGTYTGKEIVKAQIYGVLSVHANKRQAAAQVRGCGRIELSANSPEWRLAEILDQIEKRSREILGDDLYDLAESLLSTMNPNKDQWRQMLLRIADKLEIIAAEFPEGEATENESICYLMRLYRKLAGVKE